MSSTNAGYELSTSLPNTCAQASFPGVFEGEHIVWNLTLYTRDRFLQDHAGKPDIETVKSSPQLMHVEAGKNGTYQVTVVLPVPIINEPELKKAVIMIQRYKRMRLGWHVWGSREE